MEERGGGGGIRRVDVGKLREKENVKERQRGEREEGE